MSTTSLSGIEAVCGTFIGLTAIAVGLRFYARKKQRVPFLADDWCMLVAVFSFLATAACVLALAHLQWIGYHKYPFPLDQLPAIYNKSFKIILAFDSTSTLCLGLAKASALLLYRRIFVVIGPRNTIFNIIVIITLVIVGCWVITFELLAIFQCHGHFSNLWDPSRYDKYCTISLDYLYGLYISDVILDVWILALPIPKVLRLHMDLSKKLQIIGLFMLAFVGVGASIARMVNFLRISILHLDSVLETNIEDELTSFMFFQILELGMSLIAINMPTIWTIFTKVGAEVIIKMVRSVTSLASKVSDDSKGGERDSKPQRSTTSRDHETGSSLVVIDDISRGSLEAHAMHNMDAKSLSSTMEGDNFVNDAVFAMSGRNESHNV